MLKSSDNQMRILPRIILMLSLLATCLAPLKVADAQGRPESARISLVDRIAAVVNSEIITQFEWRERLARVRKDLQARNTPLPEGVDLERQVLERMIMERVQLQFAKESGIRVEDIQLDQSIARIAESNSLSLIQFRQALEKDGIPFDKFREEVRNEIILSRVREREVDSRITVSDSEVDIMLSEQKEAPAGAAEYRLAHILLRLPDQASPEQIERQRSRADEVVRRSRAGSDFGQLSATYSDAPEALTGGDLGWRTQERLPDLFVSALAKMKPGEVSEVLRSPAGFHVLKMYEQRGAGAPFMVEQNKVRHILIRTNDLVSETEARRKLANIRERIVNGVDFAELARTNSDDGSAANGGDLGWIYPGDTVPEFERVMRELKVGEISEPTRSPFGWHLIQVVERRTADMSDDRKRMEARRALREKKSGEAYQEWLRQLRDRAYVEYRLEDR
jgi:peptidyl-prolyl cis-trans isomerase SurA